MKKGFLFSIFLSDKLGRKKLQIIGFLLCCALFVVLGITTTSSIKEFKSSVLFVVLYGLTFMSMNGGPSSSTYILASESFPKEIRTTCHGISAASGFLFLFLFLFLFFYFYFNIFFLFLFFFFFSI